MKNHEMSRMTEAYRRPVYVLGDFRVDPSSRLLCRGDQPIHITAKPFQVLVYLIERRDRFVSRAELLDRFWEGRDVYDVALSKCIGAIRKALDDHVEQPTFIETRWAEGYRYIGPYEEQLIANGHSAIEFERTRAVRITVEQELVTADDSAAAIETVGLVSGAKASRLVSQPVIAATIVLLVAAVLAVAIILKENRSAAVASAPSAIRSIAVLPLKNLSGDLSQEYFGDGLTETFISELSKIEGLKVISRNSAFTFKGRDVDPREVGKRLDVSAVLEGSVRRGDDTVRVDVRLVSTGDGSVIWSGTSFDRALKDILVVQDEIGCSIATELRVRLCGEERAQKRYTNNVDAYQAYLKGRYYWNKRTADGIKKAIEYFHQATKIDPNYALAYAALATSYKLGVWYIPMPVSEAAPKLKEAATRAIQLDDQMADAHVAMAEVYSFEGRYSDGLKEHERAMVLNPGIADPHHNYGLSIALSGHFDEALAESKLAVKLDPLSLIVNTDLGYVYYLAHRCDEAIEQYQKTLDLDANYSLAHFDLALAYSQKGMHEEALAEMLKASDRGSEYLAGLGYVYAMAGRGELALKTLNELKTLSKKQYVPPYHLAWIYTGLGQSEEAIATLEKVYDEHSQHVVVFKTEPVFDPLHSDKRFQDLVRRIGLPD